MGSFRSLEPQPRYLHIPGASRRQETGVLWITPAQFCYRFYQDSGRCNGNIRLIFYTAMFPPREGKHLYSMGSFSKRPRSPPGTSPYPILSLTLCNRLTHCLAPMTLTNIFIAKGSVCNSVPSAVSLVRIAVGRAGELVKSGISKWGRWNKLAQQPKFGVNQCTEPSPLVPCTHTQTEKLLIWLNEYPRKTVSRNG